MRFVSAIIGFSLAAVLPLAAQQRDTVIVRSGEHADFSRLVFPGAQGQSWNVVQLSDNEVQIVFASSLPDLDLSSVFDLIPRDRLRAIETDDRTIIMSLACSCSVDVQQIPTGHIVIDIEDPEETNTREFRASDILPLRLPPRAIPSQDVFAVDQPAETLLEPDEKAPEETPAIAQVAIHQEGQRPLVPQATVRQATTRRNVCQGESLAADVLLASPIDALNLLPGAMGTLVDNLDQWQPNAARELALLYLKVGWGAEAMAALEDAEDGTPMMGYLAAAFDETPTEGPEKPDPSCGPASTVVALLLYGQDTEFADVNTDALAEFLDGLPSERAVALGERLRNSLEHFGAVQVAAVLDPIAAPSILESAPSTPAPQVAAGTDFDAVRASIGRLDASTDNAQAPDSLDIENALALRASVPPGPLGQELDISIARALVLAGQPAEAVRLVDRGGMSADDMAELAMDTLQPAKAAEFVIRLMDDLEPGSSAERRASALFDAFGLEGIVSARRVLNPDSRAVDGTAAASDLRAPEAMWLQRDLAALAKAETPDVSPARADMARAIVDSNARQIPEADLAYAEDALQQSQEMAARIEALVAGGGS